MYKNYYPQLFLEVFKYIVKEIKISKFINKEIEFLLMHCVKSVRMRIFFLVRIFPYLAEQGGEFPIFSPNAGKYGPEKTTYLGCITPYHYTFQAVMSLIILIILRKRFLIQKIMGKALIINQWINGKGCEYLKNSKVLRCSS